MPRKRVGGRFARERAEMEESGGEVQAPEVEAGRAVATRAGAPRPKQCRSFTRKRMAEQMPGLVEMLLKQAHEGSLGHLKILVQLAGLDKGEVTPVVKRREKSLETILLEQWEKDAAREAEEAAATTEGEYPLIA